MQEKLEQILAKLKEINGRLSKRNRTIAFVSVAAVIVIAIAGALLLRAGSGAPLFVDLPQQEATEIIGKLQEMGVSADYSDGTITVPSDQTEALRAQLVLQGYPKSGLSYEVFKGNIDMLSTDFEKETFKLYDLQDRIAATVRYFDGVADAVVFISTGNESRYVLAKDKQEPSAAVNVVMKGGGSPSPEQVQGIQRLVASAYPGMKMENVVVVDGQGNDVSQAGPTSQSGSARLKMALEQDVERSIQAKLLHLLTSIYGNDRVRISVNSDVDVKKKIREITEYTPWKEDDNRGVISHESTGMEAVGEGSVTAGVPGTETNAQIPIYPNITSDGNEIYYTDDKAFDYLVDQMKEQIQDDGGDIVDLTIGVVLDEAKLSRTQKEELRNLIAVTAGIPVENAETKVSIVDSQFARDGDTIPTSIIPAWITEDPNIKWLLVAAAGLLLVLLMIILLVIRRIKKKKKMKKLEEVEVVVAQKKKEEEGLAEDDILNTPLDQRKKTREMELKEQIGDFADTNPEIAAQLIKTWLKGGSENG